MNTVLTESNDTFVWGLTITRNSNFTVKFMYNDLMQTDRIPGNCIGWKLKVPLKIKISMWYFRKGVLLTKDNLAKRN